MDEPLLVLEPDSLVALDAATGAVRWSTPLPDCSPIYARLAVAEGVVIVAGFDWLACCEHVNGRLLWRVRTREGARVGVVVRGGRVFLYRSGSLECYDGRGNLLWRREVENSFGGSFGFTGDICWVPYDRK